MANYTTINKSSEHFNTKLYNGTGSSNAITGVGFQPDFTWIKRRNSATAHHLHNSVSGATKVLNSNTTSAESTDAQKLSSFNSDGFTVGTNGDANNSSGTFASWNWLANGAGSANTDGSINSTVSVNQTAGFSIVSWTGTGANATIGHGLGSVPKMILLKCRTQGDKWIVYHNSIGNTKYLVLNDTDAETTGSTHWNNTSPTSSVFYTGTSGNVSGTGEDFIAYCFADVPGYSKFGSYVGNGNADGTFVYTGFKPAFIMIKKSNAGDGWFMYDNKREGYNQQNNHVMAHSNAAETTGGSVAYIDILSNGFKCRSTNGNMNASGDSYITMCFAEAPLVGSNNVPCTAR